MPVSKLWTSGSGRIECRTADMAGSGEQGGNEEVSAYPPPPSYYMQFTDPSVHLQPPEPPPSEPNPDTQLPEETSVEDVQYAMHSLAACLPALISGSDAAVERAVERIQRVSHAISGRRTHQAARSLAEALEFQASAKRAAASKIHSQLANVQAECERYGVGSTNEDDGETPAQETSNPNGFDAEKENGMDIDSG